MIDQQQELKQKKVRIIHDLFAQCEKCKYWVRLAPLDETGYRTIPLMNWRDYVAERYESDIKRERWVCEQCFDMLDNKAYGNR